MLTNLEKCAKQIYYYEWSDDGVFNIPNKHTDKYATPWDLGEWSFERYFESFSDFELYTYLKDFD